MADDATGGDVLVAGGVRVPADAIRESFVRSGGPGGQNVNKVATQVQLRVVVADIVCSERQRARIRERGGVTRGDELVVRASEHRSQAQNRTAARARLAALLRDAVREDAPRVATRPSRAAKERRLHAKARGAMTKSLRRRPHGEE